MCLQKQEKALTSSSHPKLTGDESQHKTAFKEFKVHVGGETKRQSVLNVRHSVRITLDHARISGSTKLPYQSRVSFYCKVQIVVNSDLNFCPQGLKHMVLSLTHSLTEYFNWFLFVPPCSCSIQCSHSLQLTSWWDESARFLRSQWKHSHKPLSVSNASSLKVKNIQLVWASLVCLHFDW